MKQTPPQIGTISELNERSRDIFREVVESYVTDGDPVGSRTISRRLANPLSPATIRNVMADLEDAGLLYAPHTSAGRLPTDAGLRLFVDGILEIGALTADERTDIESRCVAAGKTFDEALTEATTMLSDLAGCTGLVAAPKVDRSLKHVEFVNLGDGRALAVLVTDDGLVENRVFDMPAGTPPSALVEAANYLNARLGQKTMADIRNDIRAEIAAHRTQLDRLSEALIENGLAVRTQDTGAAEAGSLIVRGQAHLLNDVGAVEDLERVRNLFEALEKRELYSGLLELTETADGVQIFIGAENTLFNMAGCSMIVAPIASEQESVVGAIGVIGPTRLNYARIIPIVDYTAKVMGRLLS